jgi:small-conductance mechanosensitive channel
LQEKITKSLKHMVLVIGILVSLTLLSTFIFDEIVAPVIQPSTILAQATKVLIILTYTTIAIFFLRRSKSLISTKFDSQISNFFEYVMLVFVVIVSIFNILHVFNVNTNTLLISGGIISLTVGLIVSTFVGDTLAGMLVFLLGLYRVGETVLVNNIPSRVEEMTALVTRFRNDAGGIVSIPNTAIAQGGVIITRFQHLHEETLANRLPYTKGDEVYTTYMNATGVVVAVDPIHTRIKLDSGMELVFMNNSILSGTVAVAKIVKEKDAAK